MDDLQQWKEAEEHTQRIADLFNQADQALDEVKAIVDRYYPKSEGLPELNEILDKLDQLMGNAVSAHNIVLGQLRQKMAEAEEALRDSPL